MASDGVRSDGRQLLLAEELALLAIGEWDGHFPGGAVLEAAYAAAVLIELRARGPIRIEGGLVRYIDLWPTGDSLLDEVLRDARDDRPRTVRQELVAIARAGIAQTVVDRLEREGLVGRRRSTILGLVPIWRYMVIPPRMLSHWTIRIHAIVRGEEAPDAREHALVPLLAAVHLLPGVAGAGDRMTAATFARSLEEGDPILAALHAHIAQLEAGEERLLAGAAGAV